LSDFIQDFRGSHRHIVDYLAGEVLHRQSADIQAFLLQTAILDRLCGPLCEAVVQAAAAGDFIPPSGSGLSSTSVGQATLAYLEQANLFIIPLDYERRWYRYHHLFAELLQTYLHQQHTAEAIAELHGRAADWYEAQNFVGDAVRHALKGNRTQQMIRLVTNNALAMLVQGQVSTLQDWFDALPPMAVYAQPRLSLTQAWLRLLERQLQAIEPYLQAAEQTLKAMAPAEQSVLQGEIFAIRAFIATELGYFNEAIDLARQALDRLPDSRALARGRSAMALGHATFGVGNTTAAVTVLTESIDICLSAGDVFGTLYSFGILIVLLKVQGKLRRAEQLVEAAFDWTADRHWLQLPPATVLYIRLGDIRREHNDLAAAEELLTQAITLAQFGAPILYARAQAFLARVKQNQGEPEAANRLLRQVAQVSLDWETEQEIIYFAAYRTRIGLRQGNLTAAVTWGEQIPAWQPDEDPNYFREFELVTLAKVRLAQGLAQPNSQYLAEARQLLAWLRQLAEAAGRNGIVIETLTLEAVALAAQGVVTEAVAALSQALTLAEPEGYCRLFLDEGEPLAVLLRHLPPTPYRDRLLAAFAELPETMIADLVSNLQEKLPTLSRPAGLIEPLSDRELEVLRLMADGYSNREIAETLIFTVATAKKHAENIYGKLGVHSRTQAIVRARELDLL
jgi:LuxR family maltose regulon positive regulatory protein